MKILYIGCHLSSSKGFESMGKDALSIGANVFQFFTRNPRGSKVKDIDSGDVGRLINLIEDNKFGKLLAHAPYTLNPASDKIRTREFAKIVMEDDLNRMENLPNNFYNIHPGNHVGQGVEAGVSYIIELLNDVYKPHHTTTVLLETMAGKGTEIGGKFEELKWIIDGVTFPDKIGVCLDTCHV
ncbi:MAG TPA: deoxyribonuclease IV, partial [Anaerovoracaceae bacterium]|nr:deoxyribonuclease IV [Anaerovoracaceae bacterium]